MPDRTNVNDVLFPDDNIFNDDYAREVNASIEDHRNVKLDLFGTIAVIYDGLLITNGTNPNTFMVTAGRGADLDGYRVIVPVNVDNIANVDAGGNPNYIAIRHIWSYSAARLPAKAGAVTYNSIRSDDYEINVSLVQQAEIGGWILLGYAYKSMGTWFYVMTVPTYRSRAISINAWEESFGYPGAVPVATVNMYHHGVQGAHVHSPNSIMVYGMQVSAVNAPVGDTINFQMTMNGGIPGPAPNVSLAIGSNYNSVDITPLYFEVTPTDFIGVQITGHPALTGGGNCTAKITGTLL
jgi:hypothetical protein